MLDVKQNLSHGLCFFSPNNIVIMQLINKPPQAPCCRVRMTKFLVHETTGGIANRSDVDDDLETDRNCTIYKLRETRLDTTDQDHQKHNNLKTIFPETCC